ncbi:cytochrome b-245 heavy chain-like [Anneissia japonica]|uniref:cytochrome b-245 heavy chain-like n=1 Tax=Anneissia japonica TaxID=1529436 RepID=UPI00142593F1|nr:cytochrome b-245 heavy chain-like [Anneissia japonica]
MAGDHSLINEGLKHAFAFLWIGGNIAYWLVTFFVYENEARYHYIRFLTGPAVSIAKACGACLNLNSMLILLPVCRNLISFLRGSVETNACCRRSVRRLLDKNLTFHKALAYLIVILSIAHCIAHFFNFQYLYDAQVYSDDGTLERFLSDLDDHDNDTWINPVRNSTIKLFGLGVIEQGLRRVAGWSGVVITVALLLMFTSATQFIRHSYFETFWFTHHLFIIYYGFLLVHGAEGVVRSQNNTEVHNPFYCESIGVNNFTFDERCTAHPTFVKGSPASYKWVAGPLFLYFIERLIRFVRSCQSVTITRVVKHPSRVFELRMKKKGFEMLAGQYIFLKCPRISHLQWHPFTLTSSPDEDFFSVHIRTAGDWTTSLSMAVGATSKDPIAAEDLPRVAVDGPFGTASIDIFKYQVGMCVAAGIGVTPFASILKSIWYKIREGDEELKLRKVYFFWVCPDTNAFEWFSELLENLETEMADQGRSDFLNYNIYLTRGWSSKQAKNIYLQEEENTDAITGLRQKTHYGRPVWDNIFKQIASDNPGVNAGVFFCGPSALSHVLHKNSNLHSSITREGCRFFYNKENF